MVITIDLDDNRRATNRKFGATATIKNKDGKAADAVMKLIDKAGVDAAIEVVGIPATFELCWQIFAAGGDEPQPSWPVPTTTLAGGAALQTGMPVWRAAPPA